MTEPPEGCPRCGGRRVVDGFGENARSHNVFRMREQRRPFLSISPYFITLGQKYCLCLDCGICWSFAADLAVASEEVRKHGTEELVSRVFLEKSVKADPVSLE